MAITYVDFTQCRNANCKGNAEYIIGQEGDCHGLLGWIRIELDGDWLTTDPDAPAVHWSPVVLPLDPPPRLAAGDKVLLELDRPEFGDWTWTIDAPAGRQRHSTFLERPWTLDRMRAYSAEHKPKLGSEGEATRLAMQMMGGDISSGDIARELLKCNSAKFSDFEQALTFVRKIVTRYGRR